MDIEAKDGRWAKILVCTVNSWNSKVGDNTFPLLLDGYPVDKIASLFIREDAPDFPGCERYFRISENKVIKSLIRPSTVTGARVQAGKATDDGELDFQRQLYRQKRGFYYLKLFVRELAWRFGRWNSKPLKEFIDEFSPDIVIYEMSRYIHFNNVVKSVINRSGARGIGCFWDDTFTYKQEKSIGYKLLRFFQRRNLKSLAARTAEFFAITPKTKREADEFFGIDCTVLTKPITEERPFVYPSCAAPVKMLYTGNLAIGREKTVALIVDAMKEINRDECRVRLDIYTNTDLSEADRAAMTSEYSKVHGAVPQPRVLELQKEADVLLFAESLDGDNKTARLSFSTKITDYYAAGKCIFAAGNADLAPMELFADADSAIVATTADEVAQKLALLCDESAVRDYARRAYEAGRKGHSYEAVHATFFDVLTRALEKR